MTELLPKFKVVPDFHMERLFLYTDESKALLHGNTVFIAGKNKKFGSIYTLAKNHGMKAHTRRGKFEGKEGTFIKFLAQDAETGEQY